MYKLITNFPGFLYTCVNFNLSGVTDSLEAKSWTNEINYEIKGVTVGDSNLVSDAPKKGRENAIMKVLILA